MFYFSEVHGLSFCVQGLVLLVQLSRILFFSKHGYSFVIFGFSRAQGLLCRMFIITRFVCFGDVRFCILLGFFLVLCYTGVYKMNAGKN